MAIQITLHGISYCVQKTSHSERSL